MEKTQWIKNTKYTLSYNEDEIEACQYYYPLIKQGYGNYSAFCVKYSKHNGMLVFSHFSENWGGSGLHFVREKIIKGIDIEELAKREPRRVYDYLASFFDDE